MFTINVNGEDRQVEAAGDTPLLWVLRDELRLTGTKYGCGVAMCGACTVHMDGEPLRSCSLLLEAATGQIVTIEGLSGTEAKAVQQAWIAGNVPQCGYCQSGQIMSAISLLREIPRPTDSDIDSAMSGNICRCGTYQSIRAAIHAAVDLREKYTGDEI